jgi:hypothetical protein
MERALEAAKEVLATETKEWINLEVMRCEQIWAAHYPAAMNGDIKAAELCLKTMDRRIKLLGTAAPDKLRLVDAEGNDRGIMGKEAEEALAILGDVLKQAAASRSAEPG